MNIADQLNLLITIGFILTSIVLVLGVLMYSRKRIGSPANKEAAVSVVHLPGNGPGGHNYYLVGKNGNVLDSWLGPDKE